MGVGDADDFGPPTDPGADGDVLDDRLREALSLSAASEMDGWPDDPAGSEARGRVIAGVRQRHRRRLEAAGAVGMAACVAVVVGVLSLSGSTPPRAPSEASPALGRIASPGTTSKPAQSAAPSLHAPAAPGFFSLNQAAQAAGCAMVRVGDGAPACAGWFGTPSNPGYQQQQLGALPAYPPSTTTDGGPGNGTADESQNLYAAGMVPAPKTSTTSGTLSAKVGQHIAVALPATATVTWSTPVIGAPRRSAPLRLIHSKIAVRGDGLTATFAAVRPGTVALTATGRCRAVKPLQSTTSSAVSCSGGRMQWSAVVQVSK